MKNGKRLTNAMKNVLLANGYEYSEWLYTKKLNDEVHFVNKKTKEQIVLKWKN